MAKVLDVVFMTKKQVVYLELEFLLHVFKKWSTETCTFVCTWEEFTLTLEDVANIMHLPIVGNVERFRYIISFANTNTFFMI